MTDSKWIEQLEDIINSMVEYHNNRYSDETDETDYERNGRIVLKSAADFKLFSTSINGSIAYFEGCKQAVSNMDTNELAMCYIDHILTIAKSFQFVIDTLNN